MDHRTKRLPPPSSAVVRSWAPGNSSPAQPRANSIHRGPTIPSSSRSVRGHRNEVATIENRLRRRMASKEIVRRALTPPCQRPSLRWRNFRPTPSRFANMSTA